MSRNRASILCECGFCVPGPRSMALRDLRLKSEAELGVINRYSPHGYGYNKAGEEPATWWESPDGDGCGASYAVPGYTPHITRYRAIEPALRYRFAFIDCALCRRHYIGWYRLQPYPLAEDGSPKYPDDHFMGPWYELYDTSFRASFNDEPADADEADMREVSVELLAQLLDVHEANPKTGLPTYHELLDHLCSELGIPGSPSFWEAVRWVKEGKIERGRSTRPSVVGGGMTIGEALKAWPDLDEARQAVLDAAGSGELLPKAAVQNALRRLVDLEGEVAEERREILESLRHIEYLVEHKARKIAEDLGFSGGEES